VEDYLFGINFLLGDYNKNGTVDSADYVVWRKSLTQVVSAYTGADGSGNGVVDQADYDIWRANFGKSLPGPGAGAGAGAGAALASGAGAFDAAAIAGAANVGALAGFSNGSGSSAAGTKSASAAESNGVGVSQPVGPTVGGSVAALFGNSVFGVSSNGDVAASFQSSVGLGQTNAPVSTSGANLLLLDLAWAGMDDAYGTVDESLVDSEQEEVHASDLALAAVLRDDSNWWDAI
jgi:hypothetical protein